METLQPWWYEIVVMIVVTVVVTYGLYLLYTMLDTILPLLLVAGLAVVAYGFYKSRRRNSR